MVHEGRNRVSEDDVEHDMEAYRTQGKSIEREGYLAGIKGETSQANPHQEEHWTGEVWYQGWVRGRETRLVTKGDWQGKVAF